ncbi:head-tail adaptor protein [Methylobacterium planeticum]|uniref:Head-tail adaptor protein n=1 Tax=Methylobacterium planeticum TaxID=2615211 RepID=A0A6N6MR39_9HYPH|nr:head-tail adaptor protein [Methylobacterium planeticum]KAB1072824.1 head-tail adaptor protein [Methylobacterium planeticum]
MAQNPAPRRPSLGARRRRFVLETPVEEPDGFGGVIRRYVAGPLLWGAMVPLGAPERVAGGRADPVPTHQVTLRRRPGLTPAMRLACGPRRFAIRSIAEAEAGGRDLVCRVEEIGGAGA